MKFRFLISLMILSSIQLFAQKERKYVREGNEHYEQGYFDEAAGEYDRALEINPASIEAEYNLGTALFRQEKFEDAARTFEHVANESDDLEMKASAFHNQGNSLLANQELEKAIESYKNALRIDPSREDSRYNLAWAQKMLKQQQEQEQEQDQEQDQEEQENEENQEQEQQDDQQEGDGEQEDQQNEGDQEGENEGDQNGEGDPGEQDEEEEPNSGEGDEQQEQEGSEQEGKGTEVQMSQEEMERLLQSLMREEQSTQEKVNKKKLKGNKVKTDKDW